MIKKIILLIFISSTSFLFSIEGIDNGLNINLVIEPIIEDSSIPRGASIRLIDYIIGDLYWGVSIRMMNKGYTSLWTLFGYDITMNRLSIPFNIGAGLKVKSLDLTVDNTEGLSPFLHFETGIHWRFDSEWSYTLNGVYNYNFFGSETTHLIMISIGLLYLF